MKTDAKGRPLIPWTQVDLPTLELIACGDANEMQNAVKAAVAQYKDGTIPESISGIGEMVYTKLASALEDSADLVERKRRGGRKGGLISAEIRNEKDSSSSPQGVLDQTSTYKIRPDKIRPDKIIPDQTIPAAGAITLEKVLETVKTDGINLTSDEVRAIFQAWTKSGFKSSDGQPIRDVSAFLRWYAADKTRIPNPPRQSYADQRSYDYDELERTLLKQQDTIT